MKNAKPDGYTKNSLMDNHIFRAMYCCAGKFYIMFYGPQSPPLNIKGLMGAWIDNFIVA